ncbi:MAG: four helix bundle protein [Candidatus Roseilinea sp.]|nr:MAG: four helix bundle protein [Candidatus Roseilinea sp.]
MNYDEWMKSVPPAITNDRLWTLLAYRLALFMSDIAWHDVSKLMLDPRTRSLSDQLYRAVGSIGANIAEGYSYSTGGNRARYFEYALGSARESREWYYRSSYVLGTRVVTHRINLLARIIQLLIGYIPEQRQTSLREEETNYEVDQKSPISFEATTPDIGLSDLTSYVPMPTETDSHLHLTSDFPLATHDNPLGAPR